MCSEEWAKIKDMFWPILWTYQGCVLACYGSYISAGICLDLCFLQQGCLKVVTSGERLIKGIWNLMLLLTHLT